MNYNAQLKAWAIDRAIETLKLNKEAANACAEGVIAIAEKYCSFTADPPECEVANDESVEPTVHQ